MNNESQRKKASSAVFVLVMSFIMLSGLWPVKAEQSESRPPAVGIFGSMNTPRPIEEYLRTKGWQTLFISWGKPFETRFFNQFNVIVVAEYPAIDKNAPYNSNIHVKPEYEEKVRKLLWEFVEDGGGLIVYGGDWPVERNTCKGFLAHWDVEVLNEQVLDPAHEFHQKNGMEDIFRYTDEIAPHPVTRDVKTIFYPTQSVYGQTANPLKLGKGWLCLVKGTAQAKSVPIRKDQQYERPDESKPGTYATFPPLAAVCEIGMGRVAVFGWGSTQSFYEYGHYMVDDIYFTRGGDGKTSDGMRLLEQTLVWLAEPSLKAGGKPDETATAKRMESVQKIKGLTWWLRSESGVRTDTNKTVSAWEDQSGKGLTAAQTNASKRPVLAENVMNGLPAVRFDGLPRTLQTGPVQLSEDNTIVAVVTTSPGLSNMIATVFSYAGIGDGRDGDGARMGIGFFGKEILVNMEYAGTDYFNHSDLAIAPPTNRPSILLLRREKDKASVYINGAWLGTKDAKGAIRTENKGFRLGQTDSQPVYFKGDMAEVLVFNAALSDPERKTVETYLRFKYDVRFLGGYTNRPTREKAVFPEPLLWKKASIGDPDPNRRWYRGIIGARTRLTGGTGTVAEYAAAARAAKLDFIAFLEDVEDLSAISKETWDTFREECRKACGPDLLVLPGQIVRRGQAGDRYFRVSDFESPPRRDMLTKDGRRINNDLYEHFESGLNTLGPFDLRNEPSPSWVSRAYNSMAVATTKDGKTDIDLELFLYQTQIQDDPKPVAVDIITSPAQVAGAAKRFVNLRFCRDLEDLRQTLKNPDRGGRAQISNGPLIVQWEGLNLWRHTYGRSVPGTERFMLRLKAASNQPLAEAIVYDGTRLYRRYILRGTNCDLTIHGLNDRQREFVVVVRDAGGRMALASQMGTFDMFNRRFMCGDRQNSLTASRDLDPQGYPVETSAGALLNKFNFMGGGFPDSAQTVSRVPWYWDGCPGPSIQGRGGPAMYIAPMVKPQPPDSRQWLVSRMEFPMGSRDVMCQGYSTEMVAPDMPYHYSGFWTLRPLTLFCADTRFYEFKKTPDAPVAMLMEGSFTMLQDGKWEPQEWYWHTFSHMFFYVGGKPDAQTAWFFVNPADGEFLSGAAAPKENAAFFSKTLQPGGYVGYARGQEIAAYFPLDASVGVVQELHREGLHNTYFGYERVGQTYRKGDIIPFRAVVYSGSLSSVPDNRAIEKFRRDFGLHGGSPAYTVTPRSGKVRSTRYVLELDAQNGGFGGTIGKAALDMRLPVRVHGVNPNWTCGVVGRKEKEWLPVGVLADMKLTTEQQAAPAGYSAYAALDLKQDRDVWIGNVVVCDQPDLILTLLPDGAGGFAIEAHNPTDKPITAAVRTVEEFNPIAPLTGTVTVAPGASAFIGLPELQRK